MSNFTSPPCHAMSFFFFPVYPSAIRGVDELALRVLPPYLLYHPHSSLRSPLSIPTTLSLFLSLFLSSFLRPSHPFHDRHSVSLTVLRPPFSCLSVVSSLLPRPSAHLLPPLSQPFPSFAARVGSIYSFPLPPRLRRYFLVAPSLPRLYATLLSLSFSLSSFFSPQPIGRDNLPFSLVSFLYLCPWLYPSRCLFFFSSSFFFPPLYPSIYLSIPFPPRPTQLPFSSPPSPHLASIRRFFLRAAPFTFFQRYRRVASSLLPGFFPFAATVLETTTNRLFLWENASGNDRSPLSPLPPRFPHLGAISRFQAGGTGIFQETFHRCLLSQFSSPLARFPS